MSEAGPSTQCGRSGSCDDLTDAWDTPLDGCKGPRRLGLLPQQPAHLAQLASRTAPWVGSPQETAGELSRQLPRRHLPYVPTTHQAPTARSDEAKLLQLGFDLARQGGAVRDQLRAGAGEEPRQFCGFCRDRDAP